MEGDLFLLEENELSTGMSAPTGEKASWMTPAANGGAEEEQTGGLRRSGLGSSPTIGLDMTGNQ